MGLTKSWINLHLPDETLPFWNVQILLRQKYDGWYRPGLGFKEYFFLFFNGPENKLRIHAWVCLWTRTFKNPQNISCLIQNWETTENNPIAVIPRDRIAKKTGNSVCAPTQGFWIRKWQICLVRAQIVQEPAAAKEQNPFLAPVNRPRAPVRCPSAPGAGTELPASHSKGILTLWECHGHTAEDFSFPLPCLGLCAEPHILPDGLYKNSAGSSWGNSAAP